MKLKNGWYILNYHDISWEENPYLCGIGGTFPPDIFREHLSFLSRYAQPVSIDEGYKRFIEGKIDEPLVSFWFDDGFVGVRRYATPVMGEFGITGAISVNSRFIKRKELFWRMKLSYISQTDAMRFLRSRLNPYGYRIGDSLKTFTMDRFSPDIINIIDEVYREWTGEIDREDAFRVFDTKEGLKELAAGGWEIANHSSAHYPVSEESYSHRFIDEFEECAELIRDIRGDDSLFWVLPFDRNSVNAEKIFSMLYESSIDDKVLVRVGNKFNLSNKYNYKLLYRIEPPSLSGVALVKYLASLGN